MKNRSIIEVSIVWTMVVGKWNQSVSMNLFFYGINRIFYDFFQVKMKKCELIDNIIKWIGNYLNIVFKEN